jgi:hypothetical protein
MLRSTWRKTSASRSHACRRFISSLTSMAHPMLIVFVSATLDCRSASSGQMVSSRATPADHPANRIQELCLPNGRPRKNPSTYPLSEFPNPAQTSLHQPRLGLSLSRAQVKCRGDTHTTAPSIVRTHTGHTRRYLRRTTLPGCTP